MTTTMPEGLDDRRASIRHAHDAAAIARSARSAADEAERVAAALADRRAAAEGLVRETERRLRAVHGVQPLRVMLALRGRLDAETAARAHAHHAALQDRDGVVAKVHGYLRDAHRLRVEADAAATVAAALPRLLDEVAVLVCAAGGDAAVRLADSEAVITPVLLSELALTRSVQAARATQDRLRRALDRRAAPQHALLGAAGEIRAAAGDLRTALAAPAPGGDAPDAGRDVPLVQALLSWSTAAEAALRNPDAGSAGALELLRRLSGLCDELEAHRCAARHQLAQARAARTAIVWGVG